MAASGGKSKRVPKAARTAKATNDAVEYHHLNIDPPWLLEYDFGLPKGRGLVTTMAKCAGEFIGEYAGEHIDFELGMEREEISASVFRYFVEHGKKKWCVDATAESGRLVRLSNHWSSEPNCAMRIISSGDEAFPCLIARRDILQGEELVWNYGGKISFESASLQITKQHVLMATYLLLSLEAKIVSVLCH